MCSPLLSPITSKAGRSAMLGGVTGLAINQLGKKKKQDQRYGDGTVVDGGMS